MVKKKKSTGKVVLAIIVIALIVALTIFLLIFLLNNDKNKDSSSGDNNVEKISSKYKMDGNGIQEFDLYFLKLEGGEKNKIYSPLSIKYALFMLSEGANGQTKEQLTSVIGNYSTKKYTNSKNLSFANALFIKDSYKKTVKEEFSNKIREKYNADVIYDSFNTPDNVNKWVSEKTLGLIKNLVNEIDSDEMFILINALGIDMDWNSKFIFGGDNYVSYSHEKFGYYGADHVTHGKFANMNDEVATMEVFAAFNNYDIVKTLGEDNIRKTVGDEYRKYLKENPYELYGDTSEENINKIVNTYLDQYIKELNSNYKRENKTTDFKFYTDDKVKVFAKDLKTYNGTTLQYVAFMPTSNLEGFIKDLSAKKVEELIGNLKELKRENFKDGVITEVTGTIPKFKFEYSLDLIKDLKSLGITNIFDMSKADLSGIVSNGHVIIGDALHKANIEFTQDGIKASAATMVGGLGAGESFDYVYDVPIEKIDLTFDKPYMFIIRDKNSGEVWFTGSVYNPSLWKHDPDYQFYNY